MVYPVHDWQQFHLRLTEIQNSKAYQTPQNKVPQAIVAEQEGASRSQASSSAEPSVSTDVFARENPVEGRFREILPTVGGVVLFMLNNHVMMHAGQVSHWRRAMGLGPAG